MSVPLARKPETPREPLSVWFPCPICARPSGYAFRTRYHRVFRCENRHCRHHFVGAPAAEAGHCQVPTATSLQAYGERDRQLIQYLFTKGILPERGKVLDLGSGAGHIARGFVEAGCEVMCVEPVVEARRLLAERDLRAVCDVSELPDSETYDLVCMVEVFEHLPSPVEVVRAAKRHIVSGGAVFVTTPSANGVRARFSRDSSNAYGVRSHLQFFSPQSLRNCLAQAGFTHIRVLALPFYVPRRSRFRVAVARLLSRLGLGAGLAMVAV
jgi:2-polyprenyl-3-methyl-5-hydroxy-6-metoxy-1,4-benzoquinol methylase